MDNETLTFGCSGMVAGTMGSSAPYTYGEFFGRITQVFRVRNPKFQTLTRS